MKQEREELPARRGESRTDGLEKQWKKKKRKGTKPGKGSVENGFDELWDSLHGKLPFGATASG